MFLSVFFLTERWRALLGFDEESFFSAILFFQIILNHLLFVSWPWGISFLKTSFYVQELPLFVSNIKPLTVWFLSPSRPWAFFSRYVQVLLIWGPLIVLCMLGGPLGGLREVLFEGTSPNPPKYGSVFVPFRGWALGGLREVLMKVLLRTPLWWFHFSSPLGVDPWGIERSPF